MDIDYDEDVGPSAISLQVRSAEAASAEAMASESQVPVVTVEKITAEAEVMAPKADSNTTKLDEAQSAVAPTLRSSIRPTTHPNRHCS